MSIAGILEAMRSERPPTERLVWQCLENHANGARCWSITEEAIARELKLGVATVARAVRALIADKIVEVERFKRRPTAFRMLREYGKPNGQHPPPEGDLTDQTDGSIHTTVSELTTQSDGSTADLTTQIDLSTAVSSPELTTQFDGSSVELTDQTDGLTPELTHQIDRTTSSTSKNPPEKNPPGSRAYARTPRHLIPDDWVPSQKSVALGIDLGLTQAEVLFEADKMRDWARHEGKNGKDWESRFNNWLRKEATGRRHRTIRTSTLADVARDWGTVSLLTPDFGDDDEPRRLQ